MGTSLEMNALEYLMALHYNQDFVEEYGGVWESLQAFMVEDPQRARAVPSLIARALAERSRDEDLDEYLDKIGCNYDTSLYPGGGRAWLTEIARRIEEWLATTNARS